MVGVPYHMGWGTLYSMEGGVVPYHIGWGTPYFMGGYHTTLGGLHPNTWLRYPSPWGGVFQNPMVRGRGYFPYFSHYPEVNKILHKFVPYVLA